MSEESPEPSPLEALQTDLGATFATYRGRRVPQSYSPDLDPTAEVEALRHGCGIFERSFHSGLDMTGADRQRFLNGLVTCDTKSLKPGQTTHGFVTSIKGRILSYLSALASEDHLWLELPPGLAAEMQAHLSKYVIVDRVEIAPWNWLPVSLIGPQAGTFLTSLGLNIGDREVEDLEVQRHTAAELDGKTVRVVREQDLGEIPCWSLWLPHNEAAALFGLLAGKADKGSNRLVGFAAVERLRIEAGQPLFGVDYDSANFPQETGLDDTVNYTKGCYLGQEIVARIHYRGGVNKSLRGLRIEATGEEEALVGQDVMAGGRSAGTLTSLAQTPDGLLGLAILHQRAETGSDVTLSGGGKAKVVALPFCRVDL